uniref:Uncharacterized protein n=1 Tax=Rhizophora mucronata TaxID=61149 RepID=A0A2P2M9U7_RHIMU
MRLLHCYPTIVMYVFHHMGSLSQIPFFMPLSSQYFLMHIQNNDAQYLFNEYNHSSCLEFGITPQDKINNWRETALILTSIFFLAAAIWFIGIFLHSVDRFNEESRNQVTPSERASTAPLLEGRTAGTTTGALAEP